MDIKDIDLKSVKERFSRNRRWGWSVSKKSKEKHVNHLEEQYRQFLGLIKDNPGETIVPWSQDLDDFWHEHIIDTRKYHDDCMAVFGKIIHHDPHLPKGTVKHSEASKKTQQLYRDTYTPKSSSDDTWMYPLMFSSCSSCNSSCNDHSSHSSCGSSCGSSCSSSSCGSSCSSCGGGCD